MRTQIFNTFKITALAIALSFGISYVYAWTAPTVAPTGGNVLAPINTSGTAQTKAGGLDVEYIRTKTPGLGEGGVSINSGGATGAGVQARNSWGGAGSLILNSNGGNVGIGIDAPIRKLHLSDTNVVEMVMGATDGLANSRLWNFIVDGPAGTAKNFYIRQLNDAGTGGDIPLFIRGSDANVGVGTTVPAQKLTVAGAIGATGDICTTTTGPSICLSTPAAAVPHGKQRFTSNGTFTVNTGVTKVWVSMSGGGGGGGGGGDSNKKTDGTAGTAGSQSSFGSGIITLGGGAGTGGKANSSTGIGGGAGGTGGSRGGSGEWTTGWVGFGGSGGSSIFGTGFAGHSYGNGGSGYGSGGSGGDSSNTGGGGGGGGGGAHAVIAEELTVTSGAVITVTVGTGGTGGTGAGGFVAGAGAPGFVLVEW